MKAGASSSNLCIMNQEFVKLDKFDGCNYTRWADKMKFSFIALKIFYVLDPLLALILANPIAAEGEEVDQNEVLELEKQRMIRKEDKTLYCGHINNSLLDRLYDHLHIEEEARNRDKRVNHGSTVHHVQVGNSSNRGSRSGPTKFNLEVNHDKFRKLGLSKRTRKCQVCRETDHYARECKMRKSGSDDVIVVNGEIADLVAHVHLDDDNFDIRSKLNIGRRHIDLGSHWRDLQLEVRRDRYSRSKLLFQNLQILFKVDFDQGFKGLRLSSFARVLEFIKFEVELQGAQGDREAGVFQVSNDDTAVAQRRLEDKQLEEKTNTDCLVNEQENVHLGIKVGANITVTGVPSQEGAEGNVAEKKKVKESMKANPRKLL
ncbi:zinc finger, CCHC-type containing protein, partial [Tanacetum coccineum]